MKRFKTFFKYFAVALAVIIALTYAFGYDYLFKGIATTYLRGEKSATIDDGKLFPKHEILATAPKPWQKDSLYNKNPLPKTLIEDLEKSETASFLIIKNGKLLHEEYWDGFNQNSRTNSFSMAKTVTVMLLGTAMDDGKIKNINQKFSDFFDDFYSDKFGKNLTLKNLASMEAGLDWDEHYSNPFLPAAKAYYGNSLYDAVFRINFSSNPGTKYEYQSGANQLLGFAIRKSVNMPLSEYLSQKIWIPLGMEQNAFWSTDDFEMEKTFCCIHSDARDFAKLGQLMLNDGKFENQQILNPDFVREMTTPTKNSGGVYGLGIWINNDAKYKHYFFWGFLGQYIIIVPEKQLVIVRTGSFKNQPKDSKGRPAQVEFLVNQIVENLGI
ncbi:MAG: beta-lactamase family protein [Flavobacteriaceae bacterium]|jgi:CubicO group peptidase (beta-lactamase class C family)|nr:beta-lactamase family protein [Flavobacteriaceae bacterium]